MKILIVGIGNMGFAVAKALHRRPEDFRVHVHDPWSRFLGDARGMGMTVHDSTGDFEGGAWDAVLAAVKPNGMKTVLESLKPMLEGMPGRDGPTVISIAAGVKTAAVTEALGGYPHVVRFMPTIAAMAGRSITAVCPGGDSRDADKERALNIAEGFGDVLEIPEVLIDAFTGAAGSGIAFAAAFIEAMVLGGVKEGLPYDKAYEAVRKAAEGALAMLEGPFESPAELMAAISSPGGTTIAGIHALHSSGVHSGIMNAVSAAANRSRELSG